MSARIVVLASGGGTNLQAILDACSSKEIDGRVVAVVSNRPAAGALDRAVDAGVAAVALPAEAGESRPVYDARLADAVSMYAPHWVVLAGWMRLLTMPFLGRFGGRVINLHPALPGEFPGVNAIARAHTAAMAGQVERSGVMVHFVPDEGVDDGPVIATAEVGIERDETLESFEFRMHAAEHRLLVSVLADLCSGRVPAVV